MNPRRMLAHGKPGNASSFYGPYGYGCDLYHVVKFSNNIVRVYVPRSHYYRNEAEAIAIFRQDSITVCDKWKIDPFFRLGWLPIDGYRVMRGTPVMRIPGGGEVPTFYGARFDYSGRLLNSPPKAVQKEYIFAKAEDRKIRNRNARARYHNEKAVARLRKAGGSTDIEITLDDVPLNDVFKLRNSADRNKLLNHFGVEKILSSLGSTELDKDVIDGRLYRLVSFEIPDIGSDTGISLATYLEMENPSTGEKHLEGVPNAGKGWNTIPENTVMAALAWRDNEIKYVKPVVLK